MHKKPWTWAVAGGVVCGILALMDREQFIRSLLYALVLWLGVSLGSLAHLMLHSLTGGRWGFVVRRVLEAAVMPLPAMAALFLVLFFAGSILNRGTGYFNWAWVGGRAAVCFAVWIGLAWALRSLSLKQDRSENPEPTRTMRKISGVGLVLYFVTVSFAMLDWIMEPLEPGWRSTMFPGVVMASQSLLGLSLGTAAAVYLLPRTPEVEALTTMQAWHDLGKLLFAFVIFWAYVSFAQFLIIWAGNLPNETLWYSHRSEDGWVWLARAVALICFFAPTAVLLFQAPKKNPRTLGLVAVCIWISQAVYIFWTIAPAFHATFFVSWMDLVMPAAVGAIWLACFWQAWASAEPIPRHDPRMKQLDVITA